MTEFRPVKSSKINHHILAWNTAVPYAVIGMNKHIPCAYKEEEKSFSLRFCTCCITTWARNTGFLKLRTDPSPKGTSNRGFQTGTLFFPVLSPATSTRVKIRSRKSIGKACAYSPSPGQPSTRTWTVLQHVLYCNVNALLQPVKNQSLTARAALFINSAQTSSRAGHFFSSKGK